MKYFLTLSTWQNDFIDHKTRKNKWKQVFFQALTCWFCFIVISNTKYFPGGEVIGLLMENSILGITDIESSKKKGRCKPGTILKLKSFIKD